jgi:ribonuclease HII
LNEAFPGGWVRVIREGPARCEYAIERLGREIHLRFEPRADGAHLAVALASMAAKYLREVCMMQFNRYWLAKVPGLKPTAGYPTDAGRFFADIRGVLAADGTDERTVWRAR